MLYYCLGKRYKYIKVILTNKLTLIRLNILFIHILFK